MTAAREKLIRYYKGTEGGDTAVRLVDLAEQVAASQKFRLSGFLDPFEASIAETVAANYDGVSAQFDGGYFGAERQRVLLVSDMFGGHPDFSLAVVGVAWSDVFVRLSHRDVLGAVMSLGIERDKIGDILLAQGSARILTTKDMASFLVSNLRMIGAAKVSCAIGDLTDIPPKEEKTKEISATVASLRADAIIAAGFGMSRSHAADDIEADKVKLNWQSVKNASQTIKQGDVMSLRGRGRLEVVEVRGKTKKGRTSVVLKRFM